MIVRQIASSRRLRGYADRSGRHGVDAGPIQRQFASRRIPRLQPRDDAGVAGLRHEHKFLTRAIERGDTPRPTWSLGHDEVNITLKDRDEFSFELELPFDPRSVVVIIRTGHEEVDIRRCRVERGDRCRAKDFETEHSKIATEVANGRSVLRNLRVTLGASLL